MHLTSQQAVTITRGSVTKPWQVYNGFEFNSQRVGIGQAFFALPAGSQGSRSGIDFIHHAFTQGAAAAIVSEREVTPELKKQYPLLIVADVAKAMRQLAQWSRNNYKGTVIAVTGSVGKTTCKELLKTVLEPQLCTYVSFGNFNNHLGVPYNLLNLPQDSQVAVFELGMNHPGEIKDLSLLVKPHIGIITQVAAVHSLYFGSVDDILEAKLELLQGLLSVERPSELNVYRTLLFNANNSAFEQVARRGQQLGLKVLGFGDSVRSPDVSLVSHHLDLPDFPLVSADVVQQELAVTDKIAATTKMVGELPPSAAPFAQTVATTPPASAAIASDSAVLEIPRRAFTPVYTFTVELPDGHRVTTYLPTIYKAKLDLALAALAIVNVLGLDIKRAAHDISSYRDLAGRGQLTAAKVEQAGAVIPVWLIDDSYNASPVAMISSICSLAVFKSLRIILVISDMLELSDAEKEHQSLVPAIVSIKPAAVFTLGDLMKSVTLALPPAIFSQNFSSLIELQQKLTKYLQPNDIILLKGSHGTNLYKLALEMFSIG